MGESAYQFDYYRQRRSNRNLDDPHGVLFQIAAELGGVGLVLFALIPIGLLGSVWRWWGFASLDLRRTCAGLCAAGVTFLGQSLVDWMWRIPGLTGLGLLCLAVAAALLARSAQAAGIAETSGTSPAVGAATAEPPVGRPPRPAGGRSFIRRLPAGRLLAATALLAAIALTLSLYLSDFYIRRARDEIGRAPQSQLADARIAASLDPWSTDPHYLEASALESMGERSAARAQLRQARRMEPASQVPDGLLGDFEARGGDYLTARRLYRRALALDPLDVGLQQLAQTWRPAARLPSSRSHSSTAAARSKRREHEQAPAPAHRDRLGRVVPQPTEGSGERLRILGLDNKTSAGLYARSVAASPSVGAARIAGRPAASTSNSLVGRAPR